MKSCGRCGKEHQRRGAKFCSDECFIAHRKDYCKAKSKAPRNMTERICPYCSKKHMRNKFKTGNFCDRSCASKYYIANGHCEEWRLRKNPKKGLHVPCVVCGKGSFYVKLVDIISDHRKTCDKECWKAYMKFLTDVHGGSMLGKKATEESKQKQRDTWMKNYGVPNAYLIKQQGNESREANEFFKVLQEFVRDDLESEQLVESRYYADAKIKDEKTLIEFYGDYWHMNPAKYADDFVNDKKHQTAKEIRERDLERKRWLEERGYRVIIVWESDWNSQRENVLDFLRWSVGRK